MYNLIKLLYIWEILIIELLIPRFIFINFESIKSTTNTIFKLLNIDSKLLTLNDNGSIDLDKSSKSKDNIPEVKIVAD